MTEVSTQLPDALLSFIYICPLGITEVTEYITGAVQYRPIPQCIHVNTLAHILHYAHIEHNLYILYIHTLYMLCVPQSIVEPGM